MYELPFFTCKDCGSHILRVFWERTITTNYIEELECKCGESESGIAVSKKYEAEESIEGWEYLDQGHRFGNDGEEEIINSEENEEYKEIFCSECFENAIKDDWEIEKEIEANTEYYVLCDECEREIEFGWSHENQGGRIWPAECTDFNPWRCFPEPRYKENWAKKGWLRPTRRR